MGSIKCNDEQKHAVQVESMCVTEMSRKQRKGGPTNFFYKSDLILGSVTISMLADTVLEWLVSVINAKEASPICISNGNVKVNMSHIKGKVNNVVAKLRHLW